VEIDEGCLRKREPRGMLPKPEHKYPYKSLANF
jgi:hypothetical protein